MAATIRRLFGYLDQATAQTADEVKTQHPVPLVEQDQPNVFWPVTGGTLDKGVERIDRNTEVRGRRAAVAPLPFRAAPSMTIPVPAYRQVVEQALARAFSGTETKVAALPRAVTHDLTPKAMGSIVPFKTVLACLVRDDLYHKMSGAHFERVALNFPLDGEGTMETELAGLYVNHSTQVSPTPTYGLSSDVLMLRDAHMFIPNDVVPVSRLTPAGTITGGSFKIIVNYGGGHVETTAGINHDNIPSGVQSHLNDLGGIDPGDVIVSGGPLNSGFYEFTWGGDYVGRQPPKLSVDLFTLTGTGISVAYSVVAQGSAPIPDLTGFEFSFANNLAPKWYAKKNIVTQTLGTPAQTLRLWFPQERKMSAAQDVTFAINTGNVDSAEELAHDFAEVQTFVFECYGPALAGVTSPGPISELLRISIHAGVYTGGGGEALSAREDITSRFEGGAFYSTVAGKDIDVEIVNDIDADLTPA